MAKVSGCRYTSIAWILNVAKLERTTTLVLHIHIIYIYGLLLHILIARLQIFLFTDSVYDSSNNAALFLYRGVLMDVSRGNTSLPENCRRI